jgi:hypothetical protein
MDNLCVLSVASCSSNNFIAEVFPCVRRVVDGFCSELFCKFNDITVVSILMIELPYQTLDLKAKRSYRGNKIRPESKEIPWGRPFCPLLNRLIIKSIFRKPVNQVHYI